ncbi:MAG: peptidase [Alteromonadales bacterium]|nr:peptidase [Alteromonadales bacterium]
MIDYSFINQLEGSECNGYVPAPEHSNSGVTIASGFDIGQRSVEELQQAFSKELSDKLIPYVGMKKQQAVTFLAEHPLQVSETEVKYINCYSHSAAEALLIKRWNSSDSTCSFEQLAAPCQTVIASVAFQYGNLERKTPNFWRQVTERKWTDVIDNLRNFGDRYATRRNLEADLLQDWLYS